MGHFDMPQTPALPESPPLEVVEDAATRYVTVENLFQDESLKDHIKPVLKKLIKIKSLLEVRARLMEEKKEDPGKGNEFDDADEAARKALETFEINGKSVNLLELAIGDPQDVYFGVVADVHDYLDKSMPGEKPYELREL